MRNETSRLLDAVLEGDLEMIKVLLASGANPNEQDRQGFTALHFAAQNYQPELAGALINGGAAVDAVDGFGNTPLWRAVSPWDLAQSIANYDIRQFFVAGR